MQCRIDPWHTGFRVYPLAESNVRITTMSREGITVEDRPISRVFPDAIDDIFYVYWDPESKDWITDINCGAQRWRGCKTTRQIRAALRRCGFDKLTIDNTIAAAQQGT